MTVAQHVAKHAPLSPYARPDTAARTPRSMEYELLARATKSLTRAWSGRKQDFPGLATALNENLRLWSTLAADVAEPSNGLPAALRAQLFYLYQFTAEHSRAVLADGGSVVVRSESRLSVPSLLRAFLFSMKAR